MNPLRPQLPIEKPELTLGLVPLNDCAPIAVAIEKGFFAEEGLRVNTTREQSWAGIRDKVTFGILDGAQMLATMPLISSLGLGGVQCDMLASMVLDLNGNAITLASGLLESLRERQSSQPGLTLPQALREHILEQDKLGQPKLRLGMVFPMSTHDIELRYWLAAAGIDPENDVELQVVPPPQMVTALARGDLAGFCVGEPWGSAAVQQGLGEVVTTKYAIWSNSAEKVLGVTREWAQQHPNTHMALIRGLSRACHWLDEPGHRAESCTILEQPQYVGVDRAWIEPAIRGQYRTSLSSDAVDMPDFHVFARYAANFPWTSQAAWYLSQMMRWGRLSPDHDVLREAATVYRPDLYRAAVEPLGLNFPDVDRKTEGLHDTEWSLDGSNGVIPMGPDSWMDARVYDPTQTMTYLQADTIGLPLQAG